MKNVWRPEIEREPKPKVKMKLLNAKNERVAPLNWEKTLIGKKGALWDQKKTCGKRKGYTQKCQKLNPEKGGGKPVVLAQWK